MIICPQDQCTGCAACMNSCHHGAIMMDKGVNGHLYPKINDDVCVNCNLCVNTCPNNVQPTFHQNRSAYVATAVDNNEAKFSTSAGIASVFSRLFLRTGGVVYGSTGIDCTHVHHVRISSENEIDKIKGSKYVQSAVEDAFLQIKKDLKTGLKVLFVGTPCQVAGLLSYMRKPLENLYTLDVVCHGVPSQQILTDAIHTYLPNENVSNIDLKFRIKKNGISKYGLFVYNKVGSEIYHSEFPRNEYITGFLNGLFYRESCYQCHYTRPERVSDITLGDYWDREEQIVISNHAGGLSMIGVNTDKGGVLIEQCNPLLNITPHDYADFVKRNGQLSWSIKKHDRYESFVRDYQEKGFLVSASDNLKVDMKRIKRNLLITKLSHFVYIIPGMQKLYNRMK